jgi:hypothetical protein
MVPKVTSVLRVGNIELLDQQGQLNAHTSITNNAPCQSCRVPYSIIKLMEEGRETDAGLQLLWNTS